MAAPQTASGVTLRRSPEGSPVRILASPCLEGRDHQSRRSATLSLSKTEVS